MGGWIEDRLTRWLIDLSAVVPELAPLKVKAEREVASAHIFSTLAIQLIVALVMAVFHVKLFAILSVGVYVVMVWLPERTNGRTIDTITRTVGWGVGLFPILGVLFA